MTIRLGKTQKNRVFNTPIEVVTETTAILGRRGSGKTNTGTVLVEGALGERQQVVILDPLDVWWGLKSNSAGEAEGFEVLVMGDSRKAHTDLPLDEHDARTIADFVTGQRIPVVLSMRHLSKSARRRFAAAFLEEFFHRKGDPDRQTPCLLAIDEASTFVPQSMREAEQARLVGAVESCVRQGRSSGIGVMLIDQRPASVNKDVLTQVELMIVHQLTSPHDRKALREWISANDIDDREGEFMASLASLNQGEAWVWSPAWLRCFDRVQVDLRHTFDSSRTPRAGERVVRPTILAELDLEAVKGQLTATIERARADDPNVLRRRIAELEEQLDQPCMDPQAIEDAVAQRDAWWTQRWQDKCGEAADHASNQAGAAVREVLGEVPALPAADAQPADMQVKAPSIQPSAHLVQKGPRNITSSVDSIPASDPGNTVDAGWFRPAHQRILDAIAWFGAFGVAAPDRSIVAAIACVSPKSSSFKNDVSRLSANGLVTYPLKGKIGLTEAGLASANAPSRALRLADLHNAWRRCPALRPAHVRLLDSLIAHHPAAVSREQLAADVGVSAKSSSFKNDVSRLSSMGLATYPEQGLVAGGPVLFPEGLR